MDVPGRPGVGNYTYLRIVMGTKDSTESAAIRLGMKHSSDGQTQCGFGMIPSLNLDSKENTTFRVCGTSGTAGEIKTGA